MMKNEKCILAFTAKTVIRLQNHIEPESEKNNVEIISEQIVRASEWAKDERGECETKMAKRYTSDDGVRANVCM